MQGFVKKAALTVAATAALLAGTATAGTATATTTSPASEVGVAAACGEHTSGIYVYYYHCTNDGSSVLVYVEHNGNPGSPNDYYVCVGPNQNKFVGYTYWVIDARYIQTC
ncbi:DUF6355 family natural product biosynthesis protein [Kribbella sp. NPDC023855]|uniref:DUF6355 family natural product biosynthesis protein n=1 Tax=Kribbella sp. NPDC023855 TaxID=3154698 RepID=UPI0033ED41EC